MTTAAGLKIVEAREEHIPFIAWVELAAARSHVERGMWDVYVDGTEQETLDYVAAFAATGVRHFGHYTNFIVAEVDGTPAAALSAYDHEVFAMPQLLAGLDEANYTLSRTAEQHQAGLRRISSFEHVTIERAPKPWIVEWVATAPEFRRRGLVDGLLQEMLERGRKRGYTVAEIGVLIGNDVAQGAYEKAGFAFVGEKRHPEFEAVFSCPGIRLLRQSI